MFVIEDEYGSYFVEDGPGYQTWTNSIPEARRWRSPLTAERYARHLRYWGADCSVRSLACIRGDK